MDISVSKLFVILAISPVKGRVSLDSIYFKYSLTGALIMEYHESGEFTLENKRMIPSFRNNGDPVHDYFADTIMKSNRNRRMSFWIRRLTYKNRFIFNEIVNSLERERILHIEHKKFLNIFPYRRFWFPDNSVRSSLVERLREILIYGKKPSKKESMLLGLVEASKAYKLLSRENGESKVLRAKNKELLKGDTQSAEISQAIREVQAAVVASISAAALAAHASH